LQKDNEIGEMIEQKDDLLQKASELEGKVIELDSMQRNDIEDLERRVESTVLELRIAREENNALTNALSKAESALTEGDGRYVNLRDKYNAKKTEANVLKEKLDRYSSEIAKLRADNAKLADMLESKRMSVAACEVKSKAYRDIKAIIEDFRHGPTPKY
jgi:chromosome segregation ATPase